MAEMDPSSSAQVAAILQLLQSPSPTFGNPNFKLGDPILPPWAYPGLDAGPATPPAPAPPHPPNPVDWLTQWIHPNMADPAWKWIYNSNPAPASADPAGPVTVAPITPQQAAPRLVRPQSPGPTQTQAAPQQPTQQAPAAPSISLPHDPYGLAPASSDPAIVDPMLGNIGLRESGFNGHNFTQANIRNLQGSDASGIYQIRPATWNEFNQGYTQYKEAIDAPQDVQTIVAKRIFAARGEAPWMASNPNYKRLHGGAGDPANTNLSPDVTGLVQSMPADMRAAMAATIALDKKREQALVEKQNQQTEIINAMLNDVPPSFAASDAALRTPPPPPNVQPIQAFQNWGVALAMLGSLLTRRPLTAALKSGAAAMTAYNKGQWQEYYAQRQNWQDNVDLAMKQNELEYRKYEAVYNQYKDHHEKLLEAFDAIATQYGDKVALYDIQQGEIDHFMDMRKQLLDEQYKWAALNLRAQYGPGGYTAAMRMHDLQVKKAREDLKARGVDWNDPSWEGKLKLNAYGQLSPEDQDKRRLYYIARQPIYGQMFGLDPGSTQSMGNPPVPGAIPVPPEAADQPDGTRWQNPAPDDSWWMKEGEWALPTDANGNVLGEGGNTSNPPLATDTTNQPVATGDSTYNRPTRLGGHY